jgi:NADH-quinone oxidoreductase subunit K
MGWPQGRCLLRPVAKGWRPKGAQQAAPLRWPLGARAIAEAGTGEGKRTMIPTGHYVVVGLLLFTTGVIGVLTRRNVIIILMSIELILNAVNINLVAFSQHLGNLNGQVFAIFIITDAAAEAAVGLGIIIAYFRNRQTLLADEMDLLRW